MQLNQQQIDVIDWATNQQGSLNLVARAGCGKTTTLLELTKHLSGQSILCAYNRSIAQDLKARLASNGLKWPEAEAATLHSVGFRSWMKVAKNCRVDDQKVQGILKQTLKPETYEEYGTFAKQAVSLAKQRAFGVLCPIEDDAPWQQMVDHFGLDTLLTQNGRTSEEKLAEGINIARSTLHASLSWDRDVIDFDDMILAPLYHRAKIWGKDWVLVDEAQDTNPARRALAMQLLMGRTQGRLVAVGDDRQAIYGFTGADSDAMDLIKAQLGSAVLPLNITYRCPKQIVALAQQWVPDIQAHESAPMGEVDGMSYKDLFAEHLTASDAILCRNTAPLVNLALALLRNGIACRIEGRDIAKGLADLAQRWKVRNLSAFLDKLEYWEQREVEKWTAKERSDKVAYIRDQSETLRVLISATKAKGGFTVDDLVAHIHSLFGDTPEGEQPRVLTLSTVHKSKGREWDRVFILGRDELMPSKWAVKDWQLRQEENLCYVAVTRSKRVLVDVDLPH